MTNLLEVDEEAKHVPPCGGKGVAITGIEIQCPALFYGGKVYECRLDCHIDIKEGDPHYMEDLRPKFQTTYTIRPNEVVEVPMHHTIPLPASGSITGIKGVRITAEVIDSAAFFSPFLWTSKLVNYTRVLVDFADKYCFSGKG